MKTTWKQKIDPAFDRLVKTYVDFLSPFEKSPREGRLNFPDEFIEPIIEKSDWQNTHKADIESLDDMFVFLEKVGMASKKELKIIHAFYSSKNADEILKICPEMIATLPEEESRQYYNDKLELYKNHPELKPDSEILDKDTIGFYSVVMSLLIRYLFVKLYAGKEIDDNEAEKFLKKSNVIMPILSLVLSSFSQLANQKTLAELKENIIKGDDKSLFKAVTIDKTFLYMEEVKKRITQAQLSGDSDFFNKLGRAIASNPLKRIGQHGKTYAVLKLFWLMGLYKLTNEELYDFLKSCGLIPPAYPDAFQKFVRRHIRSVYDF